MGLNDIDYEEGQTPLDPDEKDGLLISTVTTRVELDEIGRASCRERVSR